MLKRPTISALLRTTALVALTLSPSIALAATIQNGNTETVIGTGGGTQVSPWTASIFEIGLNGSGTLNISAGGVVNANTVMLIGSNLAVMGTVNLTGASTINLGYLRVGDGIGSTGILSILGGSSVLHSGTFSSSIASAANSQGTVTVSGANSNWGILTSLSVGRFGRGILNIAAGGAVNVGTNLDVGEFNAGIGTIDISGANSQLLITNTLSVGGTGQGELNVSNGGLVTSNDGYVGEGNNGNGTAIVTGTNSRWEIGGGDAFIGKDGLGTLTIADGGTVSVDAGTGNLEVAQGNGSTGTLNIGAAANNAAAAAGTLDATNVVFGLGTGTVVFNVTDSNHIFALGFVGNGALNNIAGTTSLTGDYSAFTGAIDVQGGTLNVNTNILAASAIDVNGGKLGGTGTIALLNVLNGGTLAPGNSIGTLNVSGNAQFGSGSIYEVEIDNNGNTDLLNVTGTLAINSGANVLLTPENGTDSGINYTDGAVYTIATAAGGVTGTFGSIVDTFAFLEGTLSYDANNVFATVNQVADFASVALTANQIAVAPAAQALGSINPIFSGLIALSADDARNALDQLSGELHVSAQGVLIENSRYLRDASLGRTGSDTNTETDFWGLTYGGLTSLNTDGNVSSINATSGGMIVGIDTVLNDWRIGSAVQLGRSDYSINESASTATSTDLGVSLYASTRVQNWGLAVGSAFAVQSNTTTRNLSFGGFSDQLTANYVSSTVQVFGRLSYDYEIQDTTFTPFVELSHLVQSAGAFSETGGAAALTVAEQMLNATFATLGVSATYDISVGDDAKAQLRGSVGWQRAFADAPQMSANFAGGTAFTILGAPLSNDALVLAVGLDVPISSDMDFNIGYDGQFGTDSGQVHALTLGINGKF